MPQFEVHTFTELPHCFVVSIVLSDVPRHVFQVEVVSQDVMDVVESGKCTKNVSSLWVCIT